jgi:sugar phosphate isomerase/epimerase
MRLRLGINTCFAVKRWPRPADWAPIVGDRLGLRLVQHSFDLVDTAGSADVIAAEADDLRSTTSAAGLELHSTFTGLAAYSTNLLLHPLRASREAALAWFSVAIAFTSRAGGVATGGHVGAFSVPDWRDPAERATRWADLRVSLRSLAAQGRAAGLDYLMVENLAAAREPSTMAMVRELLTDGDPGHVPVRLCLDVGHMCVPGASGPDRDPYAWLREIGSGAPVIQLQQSDAEGDHHWPFTPRFEAIGRIRADRVIDALGEGGATESALILEVIPSFEQDDDSVLDDLAVSVDYWREALARRGVLAD